jgi:Amt family ammonium transporter
MDGTVLDSVWVLLCAFLVFFMHAGFALVESGFCQRKNAVMVLLKNLGVISIASVLYYAVGYGLMFGDGNAVLGLSSFFPDGTGTQGGLPELVFLFFQLVFAATAATIVSGAVAERVRLGTFFLFTALATAVLYPVVGHWVWGGGFLAAWGFHDFAGSSVVHASGGGMALAAALAVGPRLGKYGRDGSIKPIPAHNFPLAALGVLILWLGWFGFNGGSTLAADPAAIGPVILATNLAAAGGFLAALVHVRLRTGMLDLSMALNGVLAGLVAITAGADVIGPAESLLVGMLGGIVVVEGVFLLERRGLDDPVGAVTVHGLCGMLGTVAVGVFANGTAVQGVLHGGGFGRLGLQLAGTLIAFGVPFGLAWGAWTAMKWLPGGIRVSAEHELEGLDTAECGVEAYWEQPSGRPGPDAPIGLRPAPAEAEGELS